MALDFRKTVFLVVMLFLTFSSMAYTNWNSGEPNDLNTEDCAEMYGDGVWNDNGCGQEKPAVCEVGGGYEKISSRSWWQAKNECDDRGGYLVVIGDSSENSQVASMISNSHWIGYYQSSSGSEPGGGWQWVDTNSPPSADFSYSPTNPDEDESISFDASTSTDPENNIQSYEWDWDGDGSYEDFSSSVSISHTYSSPGDKSVTLRVTDSDGASDTTSQTVSVNDVLEIKHDSVKYHEQGHGFNITFDIVDNDGDSTIDSCTAEVDDRDSNSEPYSGTLYTGTSDDTAICNITDISYSDNSGWQHTESMNIVLEAEDDTGSTDSYSETQSFPNHAPSHQNTEFKDYPESHKFNISSNFSDEDAGSGEIDSCTFEFYDGDGNSFSVNPAVDNSVSTDGANCFHSNVNSSYPAGFEPEESINIDITFTDIHGSSKTYSTSHEIPNNPPYSINPDPRDGSYVSDFPVDLSATVKDKDGDTINAEIYYDGSRLDQETLQDSEQVEYVWDIPDATDNEYDWEVRLSDSWTSTSTTYSFTKIIGQSFRSRVRTDLNYSSLILNAGSNKYTKLTITNEVSNTKNLTVELSGIKSEFLDGKSAKKLSNFAPQSQEIYTIRINPENAAKDKLRVSVTNNDLGITTTESIPVRVLESTTQSSRDVPGVGMIQLLFIVSAATVLYSVRL